MLWSGALDNAVVKDIYAWNRHNRLMMRLGVLSGTGSDCCGNSLMSFTSHGWGYGLLRADLANAYLLNLYTMSSHSQTRGTWTAPEEADITGGGMPYAPPSQLAVPLFLKWAFVFDAVDDGSVWLCRAAPRSMVVHPAGITVASAPTRHGKVGFTLTMAGAVARFNVSLPAGWAAGPCGVRAVPCGGLFLRVRAPAALGPMVHATLDGERLPPSAVNASAEAVHLTQHTLAGRGATPLLVDVQFGARAEAA